jgi:TolB-like protein/DNA-binding SARP family transcriptional activator/Flp pilus assembly protein TadD
VIFSRGHQIDVMGLSLKLFGQFEIRDDSGAALLLPTRKTRALLGYLAINAERPQPRERLMALLWSDRGEKQARQSLNHALRAIRKLAEKENIDLIESDGERVTLRGNALESDAARFRELLEDHPGEAAALYTEPFLDGISVLDPAFEEWLLMTRSEFHTLTCDALEAAATSDDTTTAIDYLKRLLALDPLREEAHRQLMQLRHQSGDRAGALRQYKACADILSHELQVDPDATTHALYEKIKRDSGVAGPEEYPSETRQPLQQKTPRASGWQIAVAAVVLLAVGGGMTMWLTSHTNPTDTADQASPSLPLSGKPSIAVLPFSNLSGDKEQDYFSDGMTEDILTDLSKISALTVISKTITFAYKGTSSDIRAVARDLGVSHIVEGSVRKIGGRVRITAQLIDTATGAHLWAERYDRELKDIFALLDEVRGKIISALAVKLSDKERRRLAIKGTDSVAAHDLYLRGLFQESSFTREGNREAMQFYEQALSIDPDYALPYTRISNILQMNTDNGWSDNMQADLKKAVELAEKGVALDPQNPYVHWSLGRATSRFMTPGALERGIKALQRAIRLDPNYTDAHAFLAILYVADGRAEDGLRSVETAIRMNSRYPFWYLFMRGITRYVVEDYKSAISDFESAAKRSPTALFVRFWLASAYAQSGQMEDAEWQFEEMQALGFEGSITTIISSGPIQDPGYLSLFTEGLRKAGIPD